MTDSRAKQCDTSHSPLPWSFTENDDYIKGSKNETGRKLTVAIASDPNKQFIVKACNAHYQLVAACREAFKALEALRRSGDKNDWNAYSPLHDAFKALADALALTQREGDK